MCYCGDKLDYEEHCEKYLKGIEVPKTPTELMKSRYSAFVVRDFQYIFDTYYKETRDFTVEDLEKTTNEDNWISLEIVDSDDVEGIVTFIAKFKQGLYTYEHKERSKFIFEEGRWFYYGELPFPAQVKAKANEPCPCGSGKKYKKCCGKV